MFFAPGKNSMPSTETNLLIGILVIVCVILLFSIEIYKKILAIFEYYTPDTIPPADLLFSKSFLKPVDKQKKKH
jgi:hypothetical protein